jgi:serine/threonine protein kinase/WD40 repeat protein/tetratricopeptide (TPR) repeat protein
VDSSSDRNPVEALAEEFLDRKRRGETPALTEYTSQYPQWADEIRDLFPALELMEDFKPASEDLSDGINSSSGPARPAPEISQVGDYRILREIGRGGMGVVYEAEQQSLGCRVALKVLPRQATGGDKALARFQREARAAARMHHTNIVPVFEVGQDSEHVFYAMQLIQGQGLDFVIGDLKQLRSETISGRRQTELGSGSAAAVPSLAVSLVAGDFRNKNLLDSDGDGSSEQSPAAGADNGDARFAETVLTKEGSTASAVLPGQSELSTAESDRRAYFRSVAEIGLQTARALSYAHARGIIHRDIKPSNLLLDTTGVVWVTDFGLAKTTDEALTHTGDILGTLRYMSPERFQGQCDVRADLYSLGLTLYELLVLKPAFESADRLKLIDMVAKTTAATPRSLDPRIPLDLETIVLKASDKDPKLRYQSADDLAEDLQRFINDEPILARRTTLAERFGRWSRRNPGLAASMSVAAVGLVAAAILSIFYAVEQHRFAEEQNELNSELQASGKAQAELLDEQRRLNDERSRMIDELRTGQARLARKQAEYDIEVGNVADGMGWLAHSLQLASPDDAAFRDDVLGQLGLTVDRFPRLQNVVSLEPVPESQGTKRESSSTGTGPTIGFLGGGWTAHARRRFSRDGTHVVVAEFSPDSGPDRIQLRVRAWNVAQRKFVGRPIAVAEDSRFALSPDNSRLAILTSVSGSQTGGTRSTRSSPPVFEREWTLEVRDVLTGRSLGQRELRTKTPPSLSSSDMTFSADGSRLLMTTLDIQFGAGSFFSGSPIRHFDAESLETIQTDMLRGLGHAPLFSPDGTRLIRMMVSPRRGSTQLEVRDVATMEQVGETMRLPEIPDSWLPCSADGGRLAVVSRFNGRMVLVVRDVENGQEVGGRSVLPDKLQDFKLLDISEDGSRWIISATSPEGRAVEEQPDSALSRQLLLIGNSRTGERLAMPLPAETWAALFAPDGQSLLAVDESSLRVWELPGPRLQRTVLPNLGSGNNLITSARTNGLGRFMSLFRRSEGLSGLGIVGFGSNNDTVMLQVRGRALDVSWWAADSGRILERRTHHVDTMENPLCLSESGRFVATTQVAERASESGPSNILRSSVRCRDLRTGEQVGKVCSFHGMAFPRALSPDGSRLAAFVVNDSGVTGPPNRQQNGPTPGVFQVCDVTTGKPVELPDRLKQIDRLPFMWFLNDGSLVAGDLKEPVLLRWNDASGELDEIRLPDALVADMRLAPPSLAVVVAVLSADGRRLAVSPDGTSIKVWDLVRGRMIGSPITHSVRIRDIAFSSDAQLLLTACEDEIVRQWSLPGVWSGTNQEITDRVASLTGQTLDSAGRFHTMTVNQQQERVRQIVDQQEDRVDTLNLFERRAIADRSIGQHEPAVAGFQQWSERQPDDWTPHLLSVLCRVKLDRLEEAEQAIDQAVALLDQDSVARWLERETFQDLSDQLVKGEVDSLQRVERQVWYAKQIFRLVGSDKQHMQQLVDAGFLERLDLENISTQHPERYEDLVDELSELLPQSTDLLAYRATRKSEDADWAGAIADLQEIRRRDPDEHWERFRLSALLMHVGDDDAMRDLIRETVDRWENSTEPRTMERTAKMGLIFHDLDADVLPRLTAMAQRGIDDTSDDTKESYTWHDLQSTGMAAYRQGKYADAIRILDDVTAKFDEPAGGGQIYSALGQFFVAMSLEKQGQHDEAVNRFVGAVNRVDTVYRQHVATHTKGLTDWLFADIARREAEDVLGVSADSIGLPLPNTSDWQVIYEDSFDRDELGNEWKARHHWTIEDGAARCQISTADLQPIDAGWGHDEIQQNLQLPENVLVEYETWWPEHAGSMCKLVQSSRGYFAHLASVSDPEITAAGSESAGARLCIKDEILHLIAGPGDLECVPNHKYHVQVLRQRNRLTMLVDGKEILSQRIHSMFAPILVFDARGPVGARVYFDNVKVRVPPFEAGLFNACRLSASGDFDQAVPAWRDLLVSDPDNFQHLQIAARVLPDDPTDKLRDSLPEEVRPTWEAVSHRPLSSSNAFRTIDLRGQANLLLKSSFHRKSDQGLRNLPQGLRKFGGVHYEIGSKCIHLHTPLAPPNSKLVDFPSRVTNIKAEGQFQKLHLLHTVGFGNNTRLGTTIAQLILHYSDGSSETLDVVNGVHARDWWDGGESKAASGQVVWRSTYEPLDGTTSGRRLYHSEWNNPHPDRTLKTIDLVAAGTNATTICVAITLE